MNPLPSDLAALGQNLTRRRFFERGSHLLGGAALASLMGESLARGDAGGSAIVGNDGVARVKADYAMNGPGRSNLAYGYVAAG